MKLRLASLSFNEFDDDDGPHEDDQFLLTAQIDIQIPDDLGASGFITINRSVSKEEFDGMTFGDISAQIMQGASDALAASK